MFKVTFVGKVNQVMVWGKDTELAGKKQKSGEIVEVKKLPEGMKEGKFLKIEDMSGKKIIERVEEKETEKKVVKEDSNIEDKKVDKKEEISDKLKIKKGR